MTEDASVLSKRRLFTGINDLLDKIGAQNFSEEYLLHIYNELDTIFGQKKVQIESQPSKIIQALRVCTPEIASHLTFLDAIHLFQVCRTTRLWKRNVISSMVSRLLRRHVSNPGKLRDLMRRIGAIISGSSVLWLVDTRPDTWKPGDLDIYTPRNTKQTVIEFLLHEGYRPVPVAEGEHPGGRYIELGHIASVTKLVKGDLRIDLMESLTDNSVLPVTTFHSTAVMNYITADSIELMYPNLTFGRLTVRHNPERRHPDWESKYSQRMFHVFDVDAVYTHFQRALCSDLSRKTGDGLCLTVKFGDTDNESNLAPPSVEWHFKAVTSTITPHSLCGSGRCYVAHYHQNPPDDVAIEVIARATYNHAESIRVNGTFRKRVRRPYDFEDVVPSLIDGSSKGDPRLLHLLFYPIPGREQLDESDLWF